MGRRAVRTLAVGALIGAGAVLVPVAPAGAALEGTIDIRVELDLPFQEGVSEPLVQEVTGVTPGPGPELTAADVTENPQSWCGSLQVDVDPDTSQVTITPDEICDFEVASVTITTSNVTGASLVSDTLWEVSDPPMARTGPSASGGVIEVSWSTGTTVAPDMAAGGATVIAFGTGTLAVDPAEVLPGGAVTVSGEGCEGGDLGGDVVVTVDGVEYATQAAADGSWSIPVTAPATPGTYDVTGTCDGIGGLVQLPSGVLTVVAPATTTSTTAPTTTTTAAPAPLAVVAQPRFTG